VLIVALTVLASTSAGVILEHRTAIAGRLARLALSAMLYALLPFVAYVSFAHLNLTLGAGVGLVLAYAGLGLAGLVCFRIARGLELPRPTLGALICTVILVNTGYLGYPVCVALLGAHALGHAVAYDQVVSGPMVFTAGFAVGAAFGESGGASPRGRLTAFLTRNPPLAAALAGLLVPVAWAPHVLVVAAHAIVDALLVLGFLAVGVYLSAERRHDGAPLLERPDRRVALALGCRFLVNPLLLALVAGLGVGIPAAYLLQAAMPSGINSLIVGHAYGLDQRLIATVIVWSTLLVLLAALAVSLA
jgi:predicted permease